MKRKVLLDCGGVGVDASAQADVVLISHGHVDHCGGMFTHARCRQTPATYVVPVEALPLINKVLVCTASFLNKYSSLTFLTKTTPRF